jgi:thiol:disulfide interchange protein DsbD
MLSRIDMMRQPARLVLALAAFAIVLALPHLATAGGRGALTDLGLARELSQGSILAFGIAFAGGVLTSLTPCVYPLIPITVSIFGARSSRSRGQALALSGLYVLGIAATYSALGATAALTGKAFGSAMQSPWVVGLVALVFAAMAASMFGAFELSLPASWQARLAGVGGAGYAGALAMGLVAGLVAAPCTGPVLAAALTFVATKGSVAFGVAVMAAYALGIGLLFFILGVTSVSLPKGGPWMEVVKSAFGVALLALAIAYLKDLAPGARALLSAAPAAVPLAAGAAALGVLLGALDLTFHGSGRQGVAKAAGVLLLVLGTSYGAGVGAAATTARAGELPWLKDEAEAVALARAQGKPLLVDFWADWCAACRELDHTAWSDPRVREEARSFVLLKIDGSESSAAVKSGEFDRAMEKYGIVGLPTVLFIDGRGRELPPATRVTAAVDGPAMLARMRAVDEACAAPAVACLARW